MAVDLDGDPTRRHRAELLRHCFSRGRHTPFHPFVTAAGERTVPARLIAQIDTDRHRIVLERCLAALRALFAAVMLLHAGLLLHLECVSDWDSLSLSPRGDRPSHPISVCGDGPTMDGRRSRYW